MRDFSLRPGEVAALGPSGVGKSSLLRVLAGLHMPETAAGCRSTANALMAFDEIMRREMQRLLRPLIARHRTAAVLVTHDIDEALIVADRAMLIGHAPARLLRQWRVDLPRPSQVLFMYEGA